MRGYSVLKMPTSAGNKSVALSRPGYRARTQINNFRRVIVRHCCQFAPDDVYYLRDNDLFSFRKLSVGFCPVCLKPVAELIEWRFDGALNRVSVNGIEANDLVLKCKDEIVYSFRECNYSKFKSKPFGWVYGINKSVKSGKRRVTKQYACDFYGNKQLVKSF